MLISLRLYLYIYQLYLPARSGDVYVVNFHFFQINVSPHVLIRYCSILLHTSAFLAIFLNFRLFHLFVSSQ